MATLTAEQQKKAAEVFGVGVEEVDDLPLDRPNIEATVSIKLRMSGIWHCMRRLAYEVQGTPETDDIPIEARRRMRAGNYLEPMVKEEMALDGWDIRDHPAVIIPHGRVTLTGHPDAIGSHPIMTGDNDVVIEVKTRSDSAAKHSWQMGVERTHPEAVQQAALYSVALYGKPHDIVVSTMARSDDMDYRSEVIPARRVEYWFNKAMARVQEISDMVFSNEIPEPELPAGHFKCVDCPYRTLCGNAELPPNKGENGLSAEELIEEIQAWATANAEAPKSTSPAAKAKKAASEALKYHMIANGLNEQVVEVNGRAFKLKLSDPSKKPVIDLEAFNELVDPEIREQIVSEQGGQTLRITPPKKDNADAKKARTKNAAAKKSDVDNVIETEAATEAQNVAAEMVEATQDAAEVSKEATEVACDMQLGLPDTKEALPDATAHGAEREQAA